jgi:hypothetical protein
VVDSKKIQEPHNKTLLELYISNYVDSINNIRDEKQIPHFLTEAQFDYKHSNFWPTPHTPISMRAQVIRRGINCKSLQMIINSQLTSLKNKPKMESNLAPPDIDLSFYELVLKRIEALRCPANYD